MAGSLAENIVECLQNCLNFGGIGGRRDNMVHNNTVYAALMVVGS